MKVYRSFDDIQRFSLQGFSHDIMNDERSIQSAFVRPISALFVKILTLSRSDPLDLFENKLVDLELTTAPELEKIQTRCAELVMQVVDRALATADPDPREGRDIYAD